MLIDGKALAARLHSEVAQQVTQMKSQYSFQPGLATVLVGDNPASHSYVRGKRKACEEVGILSFAHELPKETSRADLEALIKQLNADPTVHGILVQLPLPDHMNEKVILDLVSVSKDVDGFHPVNIGDLAMKGHDPRFVPCTPQGVMYMIKETGVKLDGARAVVVGRSNIVGIPVALLLLHANATLTVAHSRTQNLAEVCRQADVLVVAVGKPHLVKADWVKPGAVVIDVGVNRIEDASKKSGYRLIGDVDTEAVEKVASAISPVPGGVGPLTIAMLLKNTLHAAELSAKAG